MQSFLSGSVFVWKGSSSLSYDCCCWRSVEQQWYIKGPSGFPSHAAAAFVHPRACAARLEAVCFLSCQRDKQLICTAAVRKGRAGPKESSVNRNKLNVAAQTCKLYVCWCNILDTIFADLHFILVYIYIYERIVYFFLRCKINILKCYFVCIYILYNFFFKLIQKNVQGSMTWNFRSHSVGILLLVHFATKI